MENENINKLIHTEILNKCWHKQSLFIFDCELCGQPIEANPDYANSISDAMKIVEKFTANAKYLRFEYKFEYGIDNRTGWSVTLNTKILSQFEESLPRAICHAALRHYALDIAVEVK